MARWDWYQATVHGRSVESVRDALLSVFDLADWAPGRPKNGYEQGAEVRRGDSVLAEVWWGGNPGVHVKGTGERAPAVREALELVGPHLPSRVDACVDWIEAGLFDRLSAELLAYAHAHGIRVNQVGDWSRGQARTLYLGSQQSPSQLVLYEKGYESGGDLDWVRLEVRIRPQRDAKAKVATWEPLDAFRGSRWLCGALEAVGWGELVPHSVGTVRKPSDVDRQRAALLRQYGRILAAWADDCGGWDALGSELAQALAVMG